MSSCPQCYLGQCRKHKVRSLPLSHPSLPTLPPLLPPTLCLLPLSRAVAGSGLHTYHFYNEGELGFIIARRSLVHISPPLTIFLPPFLPSQHSSKTTAPANAPSSPPAPPYKNNCTKA